MEMREGISDWDLVSNDFASILLVVNPIDLRKIFG